MLAALLDIEQLMYDIDALAAFVEPGTAGTTRRAFTPAYTAGRAWLQQQYAALGLETRIDAGGNLCALLAGSAALPPIVIGSHTDTVMHGGRYDGALGVLCGLAVARTLVSNGIRLRHPLEIIDFLAEESTPLGSLIGSTAITSGIDSTTLDLEIPHWGRLRDALRQVGGDPERVASGLRRAGDIAAYLEVHIEQGPFLEQADCALGAVTGIVGIRRADIVCNGRADHAGTAGMSTRHDALAAVAQVVSTAEAAARALPGTVATVGALTVAPNQSNVVPAEVRFSVEMRSIHWHEVEHLWQQIHESLAVACGTRGVAYTIETIHDSAPVQFPAPMVDLVATACQAVGVMPLRLASGAGHDAALLAELAPAAMLFVRTRDGRSHCPEEYAAPADIACAVRALADAVVRIDTQHTSSEPTTV